MYILPELPNKILSRITEKLDFRSLMTLRKVCKDLRNFIDDIVPESSVISIRLNVNSEDVKLELEDSEIWSLSYSLFGQESVDVFWNDFGIILKHQKKPLEKFSVTLEYPENLKKLEKSILERTYSRFLNRLEEILNSLETPLKIQHLELDAQNQNGILPKILPYFDFDKCRISVKTISEELIRKLKDILLGSPNLETQTLELHFEQIQDSNSEFLNSIFENIFDGNYPDHFYQNRWYCRIPENEEWALSMRSDYLSWIIFSYVEILEIDRMKEEYEEFG